MPAAAVDGDLVEPVLGEQVERDLGDAGAHGITADLAQARPAARRARHACSLPSMPYVSVSDRYGVR
jgi:hypothetical protein